MARFDTEGLEGLNHELIDENELKRLSYAARVGDKNAREKMIKGNMRLVKSIAVKYREFDSIQDLVGEGCLGLIYAVDRFNPDLGYQFSTYATPLVRGSILNRLKNNRRWRRFVSLHQTLGESEEYIIDTVEGTPDNSHHESHVKAEIERIRTYLPRLRDNERAIIQGVLEGSTLKEIAERDGRETGVVKQKYEQILRKLRKAKLTPSPK